MGQPSLFDLMPQRHVWKVSELTQQIGNLLEGHFPDVWVEGEVSNYRPAQSGHLYFTLKDARAQIRCVCFRDQLRGIKFRPDNGLHVTLRGSVSVYEVRGEYQIYVSHIEPVGLGALQLAFEQLKKKLQEEGLFDASRKKPLPVLPRCIGVVTSPKGAAIRDVLRVLKRRFANVHVQIYPVSVQGDGAASEIVQAVRHFNRVKFAEVVILARGGGSLEDLWAFNEEPVARAIANSAIPVITGVGHETDFTIADFVADLRAPTPSAAAEIVVRSREEFERHIAEHQRRIVQRVRFAFSEWRHRVRDLETHHSFRQIEMLLRRRVQRIDDLSAVMADVLRLKLASGRQRLTRADTRIASFDLRARAVALRQRIGQSREALRADLERLVTRKHRGFEVLRFRFARTDLRARVSRLQRRWEKNSADLSVRMDRFFVARKRRLESVAIQLQERSPYQLLARGYAIAYDASGKVLRSPEQVAPGDDISVRVAHGQLDATVRRTRTDKA
ncbi:MAG TPA: exodeoxyribonuclease VII large subunit [Candidatus Acidoferrum sp.]|nr:exodeoxyribonuclease VII large subunit [Candidatus Acidoferrum sp.]